MAMKRKRSRGKRVARREADAVPRPMLRRVTLDEIRNLPPLDWVFDFEEPEVSGVSRPSKRGER